MNYANKAARHAHFENAMGQKINLYFLYTNDAGRGAPLGSHRERDTGKKQELTE